MAEEFDSDELLEHIFERVAAEVSAGHYKPGLQAMAAAQTEGDEAKAKALYLQLRAKQIAKEMAVEAEEAARQAAERERHAAQARKEAAKEKLRRDAEMQAKAKTNTVKQDENYDEALRQQVSKDLNIMIFVLLSCIFFSFLVALFM